MALKRYGKIDLLFAARMVFTKIKTKKASMLDNKPKKNVRKIPEYVN